MMSPNFMVIGLQIGKLHRGGGGAESASLLYPILKSPACMFKVNSVMQKFDCSKSCLLAFILNKFGETNLV